MIGELIGNYRLLEEIGRGGMGVVYRAEHVQLGKPAAVKMLLPQRSHDASIRLHGNYPTKTTNVVDRVRIDVR